MGITTDNLTLKTLNDVWVIPCDCDLLKALLAKKQIHADDLRFECSGQRHAFIHKVALLAARDEIRNATPSSLATLIQQLVQRSMTPSSINHIRQ